MKRGRLSRWRAPLVSTYEITRRITSVKQTGVFPLLAGGDLDPIKRTFSSPDDAISDFLNARFGALKADLSPYDRDVVDRHLTSLRTYEDQKARILSMLHARDLEDKLTVETARQNIGPSSDWRRDQMNRSWHLDHPPRLQS